MILGIDTSCYTTSLAVVDSRSDLVTETRQLLDIKEGERGLQQSKALFQHTNNFPNLIEKVFAEINKDNLKAIAVSAKPRPQEDSYMPVFKAGISYAKTLAKALNLPLFFTSHQEGHIEAGVWSGKFLNKQEFIGIHISGGTTEILKVSSRAKDVGYQISKIGGSEDLHAGQFIDRVGVALGLKFPAGPALEGLASKSTGILRIPSSIDGYKISFSGPESAAQRLILAGEAKENIARAVEQNIATSVEKVVKKVIEEKKITDILIVGGVAANNYIRERLNKRLEHKAVGARLSFAEPRYSSDNAVGVALLGLNAFNKQQ